MVFIRFNSTMIYLPIIFKTIRLHSNGFEYSVSIVSTTNISNNINDNHEANIE